MKAIVVDDEKYVLADMKKKMEKIEDLQQVDAFSNPEEALRYISLNRVDIAFLDINIGRVDGLSLAKKIKEQQPDCFIIFATGYSEYAVDAFGIKASGYLLKPVSLEDIQREVDYVKQRKGQSGSSSGIKIQCFGNFEVFYNDKPLSFRYNKTKELLAYLVDRKGAAATTAEVCAVIWEDKPCTVSLKTQFRNLVSDLGKVLKAVGAEEIFIKSRNSFAIAVDKVECDYYGFLRQDVDCVNLYMGEYMTQYSWAEMTLGMLESKRKKM